MQTEQFDFRQDFYRYCSLGEHLQSQMHEKSENDHFHPRKFTFFFLEMKSPSFSVV